MSSQVSGIYKRRKNQQLCCACGTRPQFWGLRCVICRQLFAKDPLPRGARQALRRYRELDAVHQGERDRETVRNAARELVSEGNLTVREAEALVLYLGLEDNGWRTYKEVADLMQVSGERVRQLLLGPKAALAESGLKVPWRIKKPGRNQRVVVDLLGIDDNPVCNHGHKKSVQSKPCHYRAPDLPRVILQGLPTVQCTRCDGYNYQIPQPVKLYLGLAKVLLTQSDSLSGKEIRFLRRAAGLSTMELAARLNVSGQTVKTWEALPTLRAANEIAARIVLASLILQTNGSSPSFKLPSVVPNRKREPSIISSEWIETAARWKITLVPDITVSVQ